MALELAPAPWLALPDLAGVNVYHAPPAGAIVTPAVVYRPDTPWIERRATYRSWLENYVAVCLVAGSSAGAGIAQLYEMALGLKAAIDGDTAYAAWEWRSAGGIVETEQAGLTYLACAVRLSFSASY